MKTKSRNSLITSLTMIVMMIAILFSVVAIAPLTAYAAGGPEKVDFAIKEHWGVCFEQTGSNNLYPITLTNENKLSVPLPTLYRTDTDDYVFDGWYIADTDTKVTQDTVFDGYTVVVDRWTFQVKDNNTVISNIKVNNVALEAGMTTAEYNAAVQGATATVNGAPASAITADSAKTYTIYHGLNKSGAPLGADEEVEVGQDYSVVTKIKLANGYTFDPNITFSSDEGMCASERFLGGADIYTKQWNTLATEVEVTINFMNTDYYFDQTPESRNLENYAQYKNWYTVSKLEGLESVTLQYEYDGAWAVFIDNVPFETNGEQAGGYVTVSPYLNTTKTFRLVANYTQGKVYSEPFEISWARLNPVIESIGIGVIAPQNGYSPEYTVTLSTPVCTLKSENASTVKNGIKWTGETGELNVSNGVFTNESDYTVTLKLVAQDGYTFANNATATVNGGKANVSVKSETEITVSYTFPKYEPPVTKYYVMFTNAGGYASGTMPTEWVESGNYTLPAPGYTPYKGYEFVGWMIHGELKQPGDVISISDNVVIDARWKNADAEKIGSLGISITAPKNENSPEYTAILTTSKCKLKDVSGISWEGENVGELNVNSKFNNDNDYTVTIKLVAEDGYKFTNSVTATVNANNAIVSVKSESEIWVSYTFAKPVKHLVTFNTNSTFATGTMSPVEVVEGSYTLPTPTYTPKDGYTFAGWLLNGYIIQPGNEITLTSPITLEARWKSDYTSVGFTVQPSSPAEKKVAQQILYRTTNFTIDPSIAYDSIIAQVYNEETGEWVDSIYDGDNLIVTAGNGAIDSGFGYDQIVFNAKVPGKYTFRIVAKQSGLVVACSENFTVTWVSNAITAQPKGDMIDIGATLKITVKTNFYIASSEIEYYDKTTGTWKLYESVGGFNWNPFSYNFTNNAETSTKFRVKLYESVGNLTATSNEFTITWTNHKHTYGVSPNGKDETNHWKECTDPACPAKAHSKIEAEAHKDNTADNKCDVCGYDLPIPTYQVIYQPGEASGNNEPYEYEANDTITFLDCEEVGYTRDGFEFDYWSIRILGDNLTEVAQKRPNETYTLTSDIIAVAMWKEIPVANYTVSFNANGGTGSMLDETEQLGVLVLPECTFTAPAGKQFKCWAEGSASGTQYAQGVEYDVTANVTFYAVWENISHTCGNGVLQSGQAATCTVNGWKDYYQCACGKYFADEARTTPIADLEAWKVGDGKIVAEHTYGDLIDENPAVHTQTELQAGMRAHYKCSVCQGYFDENKNPTTEGALIIAKPEHSYGDWINDNEKHWKVCDCGLKADEHTHNYTDSSDMTCNTCGYDRTVPHTCGNGVLQSGQAATCTVNGWKDYYKCSCGKIYTDAACTNEITSLEAWKNGDGKIAAGHSYGDLIAKVNATCSATGMSAHYECSVCHTLFDESKAVKTANELTIDLDANAHTYGAWTSNGDGTHSRVCGINANHKETVACSGGTATCTEKAVCEVCNTPYGNTAAHQHGSEWHKNADEHWNECECGDKANVAPHADENNDGKCDICDYAMGNAENPGGDIESEKTGLSGGAIAGIAVGSVAVAGLGCFSLFWFVIKKKKFADLIALFKKK